MKDICQCDLLDKVYAQASRNLVIRVGYSDRCN